MNKDLKLIEGHQEETKILEIRKLIQILSSWGNVNYNGQIALDRLEQIVNELKKKYTLEEIQEMVDRI
jgi:hypothetical protein